MQAELTTALSSLDYLCIAGYLVLASVIGILCVRGQKSTYDLFLARRSMPWIPVALSAIVTGYSAISLLGAPAYVYEHDMKWMSTLVVWPITMPIVFLWVLPFFYKLRITTVYEYLEKRFNASVRTVGVVVFLLFRGAGTAVVLYAPAIALSAVTGLPITWMVLLMGILATAYTMAGGIKAVIYTDVMQFFVMLGGLGLVTFLLVSRVDGGLVGIWEVARACGKTRIFDFSFDLTIVGFWGLLITTSLMNIGEYSSDQVTLQRFLATKSKKECLKAYVLTQLGSYPVIGVLYLIGAGLFVFYRQYPHLLGEGIGGDKILPYFIATQLPRGLAGLIVAAIFAAAMSTLDSALNSLATTTMVDVYGRFKRHAPEPQHVLKMARLATLLWGGVITVMALLVKYLGILIVASNKVYGFFGGVLVGIFLSGMTTKRTSSWGIIIGAGVGMATVALVAWKTSLCFIWYAAVGAATTYVVGYAVSFWFVRKPKTTRAAAAEQT